MSKTPPPKKNQNQNQPSPSSSTTECKGTYPCEYVQMTNGSDVGVDKRSSFQHVQFPERRSVDRRASLSEIPADPTRIKAKTHLRNSSEMANASSTTTSISAWSSIDASL